MYTVKRLTAEIPVDRYITEYVNVEEFLEACKQCKNYEKKWSCPPYDFDVLEYWKKFDTLFLLGTKICFEKEVTDKEYPKEELEKIMYEILSEEKQKLTEELFRMEQEHQGSVSLSAGSCDLCGDHMMNGENCNRQSCQAQGKMARESCRHFDKMRYSIESLGGNVGKTCSKLLNEELAWSQENRLPTHFILVCGLLKNK